MPQRSCDVLVIGAGAAGLACAERCTTHHSLSVIVLEARSQVGGRIRSAPWGARGEHALQHGAQWVHGARAENPLLPLLERHGLRTLPRTDWERCKTWDRADGARVGGGCVESAWGASLRAHERALAERGALEARVAAGELRADCSLGEAYERALAEDGDADALLARFLERTDWVADYAAELGQLSLLHFDADLEFHSEDDRMVADGGLGELARRMGGGLDVRLDTAVRSVAADGDGVLVCCAGGGQFVAQRCVVTLPLAVLQAGAVQFTPALPPRKLEALERIGVGEYHMVAMRFERPFWDVELDVLYFHDSGAAVDRSAPFPLFVNLEKATPGIGTLVAHSTASAVAPLEAMGQAAAVEAALAVLRRAFGQDAVPAPVETWSSDWSTDECTRGAYSYLPVGAIPADRVALAAPVGNVRFAGEATHTDYPSTVHGALMSGQREADAIAVQIM